MSEMTNYSAEKSSPLAPQKNLEEQPHNQIGQNASSDPSFDQMGLSDSIFRGVQAAGFEKPSPIQVQAIPLVLSGFDVIGQAQTGTGKTAAFGLPAMSRLKFDKSVEILVLTPTRELAIQVSDELYRLGKFADVKTVPVVGGQGYLRQIELINRGAQVVVATPGRLMDHLREGVLKRFTPHTVVLDEADEMLDRGFVDDIRHILSLLPTQRQTLLFSATMPPEIKSLTREFMRDPRHIQLNAIQQTNTDIEQRLIVIRGHEREDALARVLEVEDPEKAIIFCRTKRDVDELHRVLSTRGLSVKAIHGDMSQVVRNLAVKALKDGQARIIIATDVAARGIDIPNVTHVINFNVPENRERYVHRIGRTGRAGRRGLAITMATPSEVRASDVFAGKHASAFVVTEVPSKSDVRASMEKQLELKVASLRVRSDLNVLASQLAEKYSAEELAQRLVSTLSSGRSVTGEDRLGVAAEEGRRILDRIPSFKERRPSNGSPRFGDRKGFRGHKGNTASQSRHGKWGRSRGDTGGLGRDRWQEDHRGRSVRN